MYGIVALEADLMNKTKLLSMEDVKTILDKFIDWATSFAGAFIIAIIVWFIGKKLIKVGVQFINKALTRTDLDIGVVKFLASLVRLISYAILIIVVIDILGFETTSLLTLIGSAGLAFGLALQGSLSNFAGGVLILVFKPFRIGDYIVACSNEGKVVSIDLLYTKLLTVDNKTVMLPNGTVANSNIVNVGAQDTRRLDIEIAVGYNSDIKKAKELLRNILDQQSQILKDKEILVIVKSLDDSCVTIETRAWIATEDYWDAKWELLEKYKEVFDEHGIEIPFNQLDVNIKK